MPVAAYDTQVVQPEQSLLAKAEASWQDLLALLPMETFEQARKLHAFERARGLRHPADLLRGILAYVFCLSSFRQLGTWSASVGLCANGERSWAKRTRQATGLSPLASGGIARFGSPTARPRPPCWLCWPHLPRRCHPSAHLAARRGDPPLASQL